MGIDLEQKWAEDRALCATNSMFFHELQKEFIFPLCFLSVVFYGLEPCLKATFPCLTARGKEIAGMGFRNLSVSLKGEEGFFKSSSCKIEK